MFHTGCSNSSIPSVSFYHLCKYIYSSCNAKPKRDLLHYIKNNSFKNKSCSRLYNIKYSKCEAVVNL